MLFRKNGVSRLVDVGDIYYKSTVQSNHYGVSLYDENEEPNVAWFDISTHSRTLKTKKHDLRAPETNLHTRRMTQKYHKRAENKVVPPDERTTVIVIVSETAL